MPTLVLLRHGESQWNSRDLFTGWVDVDLTARGEQEARHSGQRLREARVLPGTLHTSMLGRAVRSGALAVEAAGRAWIPVRRHWRLNERCYGALQGQSRRAVRERYGDRQYDLWRRSFDAAPPAVQPGDAGDPAADVRYAGVPADLLPRTESLADVLARLLPYWQDAIVPDLRRGDPVLVVAHGNSLRALVTHLDRLTPADVPGLNIPTGMPLVYDLDRNLRPTVPGGRYLDPERAERAAAAVAVQGRGETTDLLGSDEAGAAV